MSLEPTINKLQSLRLYGMTRALNAALQTGLQGLSTQDLLAHIVDAEWDYRQARKLEKLIKKAKFRYSASLEEINFTLKRSFDKNMLLGISDCSFIQKKQNIVVTGPTGV